VSNLKNSHTQSQLLELIKNIPYFSKYPLHQLSVSFFLLPSSTNNTYRIKIRQQTTVHEYLLKISKRITNNFVIRSNEQHNTKIAFELGLTSKPLWFGLGLKQQNISVSNYLKNCQNFSPLDLHTTDVITGLADSLNRLQNSQQKFQGNFSDPNIISKYITTYFNKCSISKQKKLHKSVLETQKILVQMSLNKSNKDKPVPAHIDLMTDNILLQRSNITKVWLIDWEYSAMASPYWDIASLCNASKFSHQEVTRLLSLVLGDYDDEDLILLQKYQLIEKTLVECWRAAFVVDNKKP
jgi:thiamine kinase-like enzyme